MTIKKAKVSFTRLEDFSMNQPQTVSLPYMSITYTDKPKKSIFLDAKKVTEDSYKGCSFGEGFVVLHIDNEYMMFSESGNFLLALPNDIGELVMVNPDLFEVRMEYKNERWWHGNDLQ